MDSVTGSARMWLRIEGLVVLLAAILCYRQMGASWLLFVVLFLAPDLSMLGYLAGSRVGAAAYNVVHSYALPVTLLVVAVFTQHRTAVACALIWVAHIALDRTFGYGLKYPSAFGETHLGRIGDKIGQQQAVRSASL